MKLLFIWPNKDAFGFKPIGIAILSALAKDRGWDVELFDTTDIDFGYVHHTDSATSAKMFKPVDLTPYGWIKKKVDVEQKLLAHLRRYQPDCVAVSALTDERIIAKNLTDVVKIWNVDVPVIWGNKFATLKPEETLKEYGADFVCRAEGVEAFPEFLEALEFHKDLYSISNIWGKKDNKVVANPVRPLMRSLDSLPYLDWSIFNKKGHFYKPFDGNAYRAGDHMTNWGCPYKCTYCINHVLHKMYNNRYFVRRYSIERIIKELKYLKATYGLEFMKYHDEDFLMRPTNYLEKFAEIYKSEVNLPFVIETNPKSVTEKKGQLLAKMNCVSVSLAIETGDPYLRKNVLKRVDSERDIVKSFSILNDLGIRTSSFFMLGLPFETRETYMKSVEIARKANVKYPLATFFFPFEMTELREVSIQNGFYSPDQEKVYRSDSPALNFKDLSDDELISMRAVFSLYCKLPKRFFKYIKRAESADVKGMKLREILFDIFEKAVWANDGWYKEYDNLECEIEELDIHYMS